MIPPCGVRPGPSAENRFPISGSQFPESGTNTRFSIRRRTLFGVFAALAGLAACERPSEPERPWTGAKFPDFRLPALDGRLHSRADYAGKPLLINLWATWCPPCRAEMADLDALHRRLAPRGLEVIGISVDADANLVREYVRAERLGFTILHDERQQWADTALRVPGFPTTYLVGNDGMIREALLAPRPWADDAMIARVATALELK